MPRAYRDVSRRCSTAVSAKSTLELLECAASRWSPRPIDLDILSFDGFCVTDTEHNIIVPHPRLHERRFALELETDMSPRELLAELKRIEQALGRDLAAARWRPRRIDLDILSFDGFCVTDTELEIIVPHPRFHERRFALEPVAELDPGLLPWRNCSDLRVDVSVADLLATVANQEVIRVGGPDWPDPISSGRS